MTTPTRGTIFKKKNEDIFASMFYITENGYGDRGLPHVMKPLMKDFKYRVPKPNLNTKDRCQRIGFLPFRNNNGTVYKSAYRELQLPKTGPSDKHPVILVVLHKGNPMQRILATAVLVPYAGGVKLEYLCARKGKGYGTTLMNLLLQNITWKTLVTPIAQEAHGPKIVKMTLNNNSNKPGFYEKLGFTNTKKTIQLSPVNTTLDNTNQTENKYRNTTKTNGVSNTSSNTASIAASNNTSNTTLNKKREARVLQKVVYEQPETSGRRKRKLEPENQKGGG